MLVAIADAYGLKGTVVVSASGTSAHQLKAAFKKALDEFKPTEKDSKTHIRKARRSGIRWEPEVETPASRPRR